MAEMKTLNGYEVVDEKARKDIEALKNAEVDLTGYATEAYVNQAIENITEVDVSQYALKSDVPTKVSQLQNDSNFITREEVPVMDLSEYITEAELNAKDFATESFVSNKIAEAQVGGSGSGEIDLSGYATKDDIKNFITEVPAEYITESELSAKGYITDISDKADKNHTHSEYITEHQSLSDYATKTYVAQAISGASFSPSGNGKIKIVLPMFNGSTRVSTEVEAQIRGLTNYMVSTGSGNPDVFDKYEIYQTVSSKSWPTCEAYLPVISVTAMWLAANFKDIVFKCAEITGADSINVIKTYVSEMTDYPDMTATYLSAKTTSTSFYTKSEVDKTVAAIQSDITAIKAKLDM